MDREFCILRMTSSSDMSGGCHHWAEATNLLYWLQQRQTQLTRADTRHKKEGTSATFLYLFASTASRLIITLYLYFEIFTSFKLNFPKQVHDASSCKENLSFLISFFVEYTCISFFTKNISQNHTQQTDCWTVFATKNGFCNIKFITNSRSNFRNWLQNLANKVS